MSLLFLASLALVVWTFAGYPALVIALARKKSAAPGAVPVSVTVGVTVVIATRNEATRIRQRVDNVLASHYPDDLLHVLVVDDGSSDGTAERVAQVNDDRVRLLRLPTPLGKAAALSRAMVFVDTPLTIFADARQSFETFAVRRLVDAFDQPSIGLAAGRLELAPDETTGLYWRLETALRRAESRLGWAHAATGAIYAIRTALFTPMPAGLILDDVWTPVHIARQGHRLVFVDDAVAREPAAMSDSAEFRRKLRTLSGNWQLLARAPWLLVPQRNRVFFAWFSHKFLRLIAPWGLVLALVSSLLGVVHGAAAWLQLAFWLQLTAYGTAVLALLAPALARRVPLATAAGAFLLLNFAAMVSLPAAWLGQRHPGGFWRR
ncbi:MAG: glycosyltransferase [Xanthomonadaceae bacterium]|nr:glycosyltransferase [Xanthomonadaceae bacterium]